MWACRSLQREANYVDLDAQPTTGANQADLRHLLPSDITADTVEAQTASTPDPQTPTSTVSTVSIAPDPAANAPSSSKSSKTAKPAKKTAKPETVTSAVPVSLQDTAESIVQQVGSQRSEHAHLHGTLLRLLSFTCWHKRFPGEAARLA